MHTSYTEIYQWSTSVEAKKDYDMPTPVRNISK
jgi:hypothetical protein